MLSLHVDKLLHGKALVVREVDEQRLRHNLEVLFDSEKKTNCRVMQRAIDVSWFTYDYGLDFDDELM